jgi:hypothetical protein
VIAQQAAIFAYIDDGRLPIIATTAVGMTVIVRAVAVDALP